VRGDKDGGGMRERVVWRREGDGHGGIGFAGHRRVAAGRPRRAAGVGSSGQATCYMIATGTCMAGVWLLYLCMYR
jgi:hypothetical protein